MVDVREAPLTGVTVAITADRKGAELQAALQRLGARVVWGPTMRAVPPEVDELLTAETRALLEVDPTWFAVSTGSGLRAWLAAAHRSGLGQDVEGLLRRTRTVARGSKSHGALRAVGVDPVFVSAKETMDDVCSWLAGQVRADDVLGAQVHGGEVIGTLDALRPQVSTVLTVSPYRWVLPSDLVSAQQVVQAIVDGGVDVLAQTSAPSARNLFAVADDMGLRETVLGALRADVCVASVGPVTARAFEEVAVAVDVMPQRPRTGDLLRSIVHWATMRGGDAGAGRVAKGGAAGGYGIELDPAAAAVRIGPQVVRLGSQEFAVLAAMVRRPGVVLKPADLALQAWGHRVPHDVRQVRHEISRIRRKLGEHAVTVRTVRGVGYKYVPPEVR